MQVVLKDNTSFECTDFYYQCTSNDNRENNSVYSLRFEPTNNPKEFISNIQSAFTKDNISKITIVSLQNDAELRVDYDFTTIMSISMSIRDNVSFVEIRLV